MKKLKLCKDCKWAMLSPVNLKMEAQTCTHKSALLVDYVNGHNEALGCFTVRQPDGKCGPSGKLFEAK